MTKMRNDEPASLYEKRGEVYHCKEEKGKKKRRGKGRGLGVVSSEVGE